jgi:hypothetical protein
MLKPPQLTGRFAVLTIAASFISLVTSAGEPSSQGVMLQHDPASPGQVRIEIDGEWFANYCFTNTSRPYLFPVLGPGCVQLARRWPLEPSSDEAHDHPHHRSLWHSHGDVNGVDFWSESSRAGKTVHVEFKELKSGRQSATLTSLNHLVANDGRRVGSALHTLRVHRHAEHRVFDYDVTLHATDGDLTLGDTKEGTMAIRLAESMRLKSNEHYAGKPTGHIVNSEGVRDGATWGKRAAWVDYHGPVGDQTMGVAIFDHPGNPRHPTWWHVRDYGLFAANPFGIADFERKPAGTGDLTIPAGEKLTFRYRFILHRGDEEQAGIAELYRAYAQ